MLEMLLPMLGIKKEDLPPPETLQHGFAYIAELPETLARLEEKLDRLLLHVNCGLPANNARALIEDNGDKNV